MLTIIESHKKQILLIVLFILMLPIIGYLKDIILTFGQCTGTALRMYVEGVCTKIG